MPHNNMTNEHDTGAANEADKQRIKESQEELQQSKITIVTMKAENKASTTALKEENKALRSDLEKIETNNQKLQEENAIAREENQCLQTQLRHCRKKMHLETRLFKNHKKPTKC